MNSFGRLLRFSSFGTSHGYCVGGILDGLPAGSFISKEQLQQFLDLRKPSLPGVTTSRSEEDEIRWLSGLSEDGYSCGDPIAFIVANKDARSEDYADISRLFRPAHADYSYWKKYGLKPQPGGGRASARETVARCIAGGIAKQFLAPLGIHIDAYLCAAGPYALPDYWDNPQVATTYSYATRCPDAKTDAELVAYLHALKQQGDSAGGIVACHINGLPAGIGEPLYDKLSARLAEAMLSINAARGFELGDGFALAATPGSAGNDPLVPDSNGRISFASNHQGGILGGISTGQEVRFRTAFKPTPTISLPQQTTTLSGDSATLIARGRHDACVAIRAVPVVEAMTALVVADMLLLHNSSYNPSNFLFNPK